MVAMKNTTFLSAFRISLLLGAMFVHFSSQPAAATEVKAHYTGTQGKAITLKLAVGNPPPNTIIVIQTDPPGAKIIRSTPPYKSNKKKHGEIKWLIKKPAVGNMTIQLQLQNPVSAGSVSAMIRYLDANNGTFKTEMVK